MFSVIENRAPSSLYMFNEERKQVTDFDVVVITENVVGITCNNGLTKKKKREGFYMKI